MRRLKIVAALFSLLAVTGILQVSTAAPAEAAGSVQGCPRGAFCIYPGPYWNGGRPEYVFFRYGAHNLYNEIGWRYTYNNQYADPAGTYPPTVAYCRGYNGTGGARFANNYLGAGSFDATPINSIELIRYSGGGSIHVC